MDIGVIFLYLIGITAFGCSFYFRRDGRDAKTFMIGGGNIPDWVVSLSLLATFIISIGVAVAVMKAMSILTRPIHINLGIVLATIVIFFSGYLMGCVAKRKSER